MRAGLLGRRQCLLDSRHYRGRRGEQLVAPAQKTRFMARNADPLPIAITVSRMATAERLRRAEIELIIRAAMIGAVPAAANGIVAAMIAETRRQRPRSLPVYGNNRHARHPMNLLVWQRPKRARGDRQKRQREGRNHNKPGHQTAWAGKYGRYGQIIPRFVRQ